MLPADSPFASLSALGPHPAADELRAYAEGTLDPAEQHRIEAHTLDCERCSDVAAGFAMTPAPATDKAVAALRTRLQARIGAAEPEPVAAPWAWPRVAAAAAALALVAGGLWSREHYQTPLPAATTRLEMPAAAPATAPATESAAPPLRPSASEVAATAPVASAPDYAVVLPSPARPSAARRLPPLARPHADRSLAPPSVTADAEAASADQQQASETAGRSAAAEGMLASAPVAPPEAANSSDAKKMTDPLASPDEAAGVGSSRKAKAASAPMVASAPVGRGLLTRMPAAAAVRPAPVMGFPALRDYVRRQVSEFDAPTKEATRVGLVRIQFIVGTDGKLSNLKVVRGLGAPYDAEALRIVCEGPAWQPGIAGGRLAPLPAEIEVFF